MSKEIVDLMVDGGQAKAGASLAQPLAPLGVNLQAIITKINEKTSSFNGMKVPVKVTVDTETKDFDLEIGTPPISELIKKELKVDKSSGTPDKNKIGNLAMEQIVKLAQMKQDSLLSNNFRSSIKSVIGSCNSNGVLVEGKISKELTQDINTGKYDDIINHQRTEVSAEKKSQLQEQLAVFQEKLKKEVAKLEAEKKAAEEKTKKTTEAAPTTDAKVEAKEGDKKSEAAAKDVKKDVKDAKPAAGKKEAKK